MSPSQATAHADRPTLPSIHSLNLLCLGSRHPFASVYNKQVEFHHARRASTSSTGTSASSSSRDEAFPPSPRIGSPACEKDMNITMPDPNSNRATLIPCDLCSADALVVIPLSSAPPPYSLSPSSPSLSIKPPTLFFTGPAVDHVRKSQHIYSRHARLHPYRIAKDSQRPPGGSVTNVARATPLRPPSNPYPLKGRVKLES